MPATRGNRIFVVRAYPGASVEPWRRCWRDLASFHSSQRA